MEENSNSKENLEEYKERISEIKDHYQEVISSAKEGLQDLDSLKKEFSSYIAEDIEEKKELFKELDIGKDDSIKTGVERLDKLLLGGLPPRSNVSVYGPPHVGKEVLVNSFVADGLEKGVPVIWLSTDKTISDIEDEMKFVLPAYEKYEEKGLVHYLDAYSKGMGKEDQIDTENISGNILFMGNVKNTPHQDITEKIDRFCKDIEIEGHDHYRVMVESLSTILAYKGKEKTHTFLREFSGKRKRENAVSLYTLEKGFHSPDEISMVDKVTDGAIEMKSEELETFLRVKGLGEVQTRDWIKYNFDKKEITMGSFSLDTIRD